MNAQSEFRFDFEPEEGRWRLANGVVEAVFQLTPAGTFQFQSLAGLPGEGVWRSADLRPTSLVRATVADNVYTSRTRYIFVRQFAQPVPNGYKQTIVLLTEDRNLQVTLELFMYRDQPVIRHRVTLKNLQTDPVYVTLADLLPWSFADELGTFRTIRVNQWGIIPQLQNFEPLQDILDPGGTPIEVHSGSRGQHCSWFALADQTGRGLFGGWEFDGKASGTLQHIGESNSIRISVLMDTLHHPIAPGAEFALPAAFLGVFKGDWDDAGFQTQRFADQILAKAPPDPNNFPYVVWDSWAYDQTINENRLLANAEIAAGLGFELFVVDLGWANKIGDWKEDRGKFPSGLRALSDFVHSRGMKFGLHFALAEAAPDAPVLLNNPDWTSSETYHYHGANSLCLSNRPARDWIVQQAIQMIDDYGVDWILQDGENMVKQCNKTTHTHDPKDSNYSNSVEGLNAVIEAIQAARPNVVWENGGNGGTMMTFNMVQKYVTSMTNDASGTSDSRKAAYGATFPFPPRYADRYMTGQVIDSYTTRSFMFGGPWIFMNRLPDLSSEERSFVSAEVKAFKNVRSSVRDAKIYHLSAPARDTIDAIQSYDAKQRSGVAVVTRDGGELARYQLSFRGLEAETLYQVTFQDDPRTLSLTGLQLMRDGVSVSLPKIQCSEIVFVNAAG